MWVDLLTWSKKGRNDVKYVFSQLIFWKMNAVPLSLFIGMHFVSNAILLSLPGWFSLYLQSIKFRLISKKLKPEECHLMFEAFFYKFYLLIFPVKWTDCEFLCNKGVIFWESASMIRQDHSEVTMETMG